MCIIKNAAVCDGGRVLCQATYILEGDNPLVPTSYTVFSHLNAFMDYTFETKNTKLILRDVLNMIYLSSHRNQIL